MVCLGYIKRLNLEAPQLESNWEALQLKWDCDRRSDFSVFAFLVFFWLQGGSTFSCFFLFFKILYRNATFFWKIQTPYSFLMLYHIKEESRKSFMKIN